MRNHINPALGSLKLTDLRGDIIQSLYNEKMRNGNLRRKGGMKPKTIKNMHNMLHKAFEQAVKNDILIKNPLDDVGCVDWRFLEKAFESEFSSIEERPTTHSRR